MQKKQTKMSKNLHNSKKSSTFAPALKEMAGWMSDLVSGLQNRIERFDSATGLQKESLQPSGFFH